VQNLLWGVAGPIFGLLADRYGTAKFIALGGVLYAVGLAVMALGDSLGSLHLGAGLLVGLGVGAAGFPLVLAAVARIAPHSKQALWLGLASAGGSLGMFLLLPASQIMIDLWSWQGALWGMAALALFMVVLAPFLSGRPATPLGPQQSLGQALSEAGGHGGYWLLNIGFFVCGFHVAFVATHLPGYLVTCNLDPLVGAAALGLIGFFNIVGGLLAGVLGGRFPRKYVLSAIYLARALVIALFMIGPKTEMAVWIFSAAFGLLWLSTVPLTSGLVGQIFGLRYMATLFGIVMLSHQVGGFLGAWLGGLAYDLYGSYDVVWYISIALGLIAALVHAPIADRPLRPSQTATA